LDLSVGRGYYRLVQRDRLLRVQPTVDIGELHDNTLCTMGCSVSSEAGASSEAAPPPKTTAIHKSPSASEPLPHTPSTKVSAAAPAESDIGTSSTSNPPGTGGKAGPTKGKLRPEVLDVTRDATSEQKAEWWEYWKRKWDTRIEEEYHYTWSAHAAQKNYALQEEGLILGRGCLDCGISASVVYRLCMTFKRARNICCALNYGCGSCRY
jgi:hypothetical protein